MVVAAVAAAAQALHLLLNYLPHLITILLLTPSLVMITGTNTSLLLLLLLIPSPSLLCFKTPEDSPTSVIPSPPWEIPSFRSLTCLPLLPTSPGAWKMQLPVLVLLLLVLILILILILMLVPVFLLHTRFLRSMTWEDLVKTYSPTWFRSLPMQSYRSHPMIPPRPWHLLQGQLNLLLLFHPTWLMQTPPRIALWTPQECRSHLHGIRVLNEGQNNKILLS